VSRRAGRAVTELALLGVAVIGAAAIGRLMTGGAAWRGVVLTAVVGEALTAVAGRRLSAPWSSVVGTAGVALSAVWLAAPARALWHGLPDPGTLRILGRDLRAVGSVHFPMAGRPGVVLIAALIAGVAGVGTRAVPGALGLGPGLVVLAGSTVARPSGGVALLAVLLAGAGAVVLVTRTAERAGALLATATVLASLVGVVVVSVATGAGATSGGGPAVAGVPPTALSLVSHLTALQIRDPDLVLFTADTPLPTYWQVGSLSVLSGDTWVPDPATAAALAGRATPAPSAVSPGGPTFTVAVTVANLSSRLLPVPPATTAVSGATLSAIGARASAPSAPGLHYTATATVPETNVGQGTQPAGAAAADAGDTQLPGLPPAIAALARSITATASTPLEKAEALTNWFRSRLFHYSLQPSGAPLIAFLTVSHTGSCEQFAGAYAVLARAAGLPTRVAIGFTTGVRDPAGQTVVRGIDAHAWPQVFLGGSWISFEPTPERPSGELSPPGVIGVSAVGHPNPIAPTSIPGSRPGLTLPVPTTPTPVTPVAAAAGPWWWLAPLLGVVLIVVVGSAVGLRRRRRRSPGDELVRAWAQIDKALARGDLGRPPWRTPVVHSRFVRTRLAGGAPADALADLEWLADSIEDDVYGGRAANDDDARRARAVGRRVARRLSSTGVGRG
jgi:transglutaminase-like putative cysteine protease